MRISEKIRQLRLAKGLTLDALAGICNLSKGYLSKVERSADPPPVSTLQTIAAALGVDAADFFDTLSESTPVSDNLDIVRVADMGKESASQVGYSYTPLVSRFRNKYMSPFLMTVKPGETSNFTHDSEEFCYLIEGAVKLCYEGKSYDIEPGDSFYFDSRKPHSFANATDSIAIILSVNFNYRRF